MAAIGTVAFCAATRQRQRSPRRPVLSVLAVAAVVAGAPMAGITIAVAGLRPPTQTTSQAATESTEIPSEVLTAYQSAADTYSIDWAILAAIGWEECRQGTSQLPGCLPDTTNPTGARGYMQFLGTTWRTSLEQHELEPRTSPPAPHGQGFATDGDNDGHADPWSWPDAAHSAARYLAHLDITQNPREAIYGYNHDHAYVDRVLTTADNYRNHTNAPNLTTVQGITVNTQIATNLAALLDDAAADGIELHGAGYRSHARQIELRRAHCGTSEYAIYRMPSSQCSPPTARPGASLHEQGLAVDFANCSSRSTRCWQWLNANAAVYGLFNLPSEPWHWSTSGT